MNNKFIENSKMDILNKYFPNLNSSRRNYLLLIAVFNLSLDESLFNKIGERYLAVNIIDAIEREGDKGISPLLISLDKLMQYKKIDDSDLEFVTNGKFVNSIVDSFIDEFFKNEYWKGEVNYDVLLIKSKSGLANPFVKYNFSANDKIKIFFDAANCTYETKKNLLLSLKFKLNSFQNLYKKLEWFNDDERLSAACDYFKKRNHIFNEVFLNSDELKSFFYSKYGTNQDSLELAFGKIRALFGNRKNRLNKITKQANFSLSEKSIKNIKKMSMEYGVTKSKIIDIVFSEELLLNEIKNRIKKIN